MPLRLLSPLFALIVAVTLTVGACLTLIFQQRDTVVVRQALAEAIDVAGQQRTLTQRLGYVEELYATTTSMEKANTLRTLARDVIRQLNKGHARLVEGDLATITEMALVPSLVEQYHGSARLHARFLDYLSSVEQHIATPQVRLDSTSRDRLAQSTLLMLQLDTAATLWRQQHDTYDDRVTRQQTLLLSTVAGLTIVNLLLALMMINRSRELQVSDLGTSNANVWQGGRGLSHQVLSSVSLLARNRRDLSVLLIRIDKLDYFREQQGETFAKDLEKFAQRLIRERVRRSDIAGILKSGRMVIFCPETDRKGAVVVAESIRRAVSTLPFVAMDVALPVTISIGVGTLKPTGFEEFRDLVQPFMDEFEPQLEGQTNIVRVLTKESEAGDTAEDDAPAGGMDRLKKLQSSM